VSGIAPYNTVRLISSLMPSGMGPLSLFTDKFLWSKAQPSQTAFRGAWKPQSEWNCSLQECQIGQLADAFWDGPAQLILVQDSVMKGPAKSDRLSGSRKPQSEWDYSLQHSQVDQLADPFWDGPAQLVLAQDSVFKRPSQVRPSFGEHGSHKVDMIAPYNTVRLTSSLMPSGMGPLSWFWSKSL
jgi:hypothetical protein